MLSYIRGTSTTAGLTVKAFLDDTHYKKGQRVTKEDFERLNLSAHAVCPNWNYTIKPKAVNGSLLLPNDVLAKGFGKTTVKSH